MKQNGFFLGMLVIPLLALANAPSLDQLNKAEQQITLIRNNGKQIPLQNLDTIRILSVSIGASSENAFNAMMRRYMNQKDTSEMILTATNQNIPNKQFLFLCRLHLKLQNSLQCFYRGAFRCLSLYSI